VLVAGATVVGFVVLGAVQWLLRSRRRKAASP